MLDYKEVDRDVFFKDASSITYRDDDIKEAKEFGCSSIIACFNRALAPFSRFFIVYEDEVAVCAIMLRRDGNIVFFISNTIKSNIGLIKKLRELAHLVVGCCGTIITKTALWYDEAQRLNNIIGFKPYKLNDKFGLYILER